MLDLLVIGAGINGAGIARDAAGRGLRVALVDRGDVGGGTSSASTKLIHGGLRYLETHEFRLVAKALAEREVVLANAPHIAWPLGFVLPHAGDLRPAWMIRAGLLLYDHLARRVEVPGSRGLNLARDPAGRGLRAGLTRGFRYWDGWIDDARLVVLNARDAAARGAEVVLRDGVARARRIDGGWEAALDSGRVLRARRLVNAAGPWAHEVATRVLGLNDAPRLRLVQGAHIVTHRVNPTDDSYILQGADRRIVFVIPYEERFSLIGTTERAIAAPDDAACSADEEAYLLAAANRWLRAPLSPADIVHRFAGVRPLIEEAGVSDREASRDWRLHAHRPDAVTVLGGKLTTYRLLAQETARWAAPGSRDWTHAAPLPGGDVPRRVGEGAVAAFARFAAGLEATFPGRGATALARRYGADAEAMLETPGRDLGDGVTEAEIAHLATREWAATPDDILWRRTKLGLRVGPATRANIAAMLGAPVVAASTGPDAGPGRRSPDGSGAPS
jgi:glycerol-3-phosphate dehydrogenase